ncbi:MAG: flavodoxin family protein [Methanobacteriota archaeon]
MKVLGIVCSPRKGGNTEILVREALAGASECGAETELLTMWDKEIKPCDACSSCHKTGKCHIKDDMQSVYEKMLNADGIVMGSPVYFYTLCAQAKILLDRTYALRYPKMQLANKVGGAIAVAGRQGAQGALDVFLRYFMSNHMFPVEQTDGFAVEKGAIKKDQRAMKSSYEIGRQIASLIKQKPKFPDEFDVPLYRLIKRKYNSRDFPSD